MEDQERGHANGRRLWMERWRRRILVRRSGERLPWKQRARRPGRWWDGTMQEMILYTDNVNAASDLIIGNIAWSYSV